MNWVFWLKPVADLGGAQGARAPPLGTQILSISCSFQENLAKLYVGAPPWENPGSAAANQFLLFIHLQNYANTCDSILRKTAWLQKNHLAPNWHLLFWNT